jgi:hypothetical protein
MLKASNNNYQVCLLNSTEIDLSNKPNYLKDIDIHYFDEKFMEMDLIVMMGQQVHNAKIEIFKKDPTKRFIGYKCGNNYINHLQTVLFKENEKRYIEYETNFDELWYVPQQHQCNSGFYSTLYRTNAIQVPFIWHQKFLYESVLEIQNGHSQGKYKKDYRYDSRKEKKVIGIMEPNIDVVKFALIPTMIAEESYRTKIGKEKIDALMITNAQKLKDNNEFLSIIKTYDLYRDGKVTAESRYQTAFLISQYIDILVCHQFLNPLNYLYLDAAYLGYPVLHNAPLCKDLGYYYQDGDTKGGGKMLSHILKNHDNNILEYHERNNIVLNRYHAENKELIETYDRLIEGLFNGGNRNLKYNSKTNLYK